MRGWKNPIFTPYIGEGFVPVPHEGLEDSSRFYFPQDT